MKRAALRTGMVIQITGEASRSVSPRSQAYRLQTLRIAQATLVQASYEESPMVGRPRREAAARRITIAEGYTKNHRNLLKRV